VRARLAIVLGSGFQGVLKGLRVAAEIPYRAIPGFRPAGVGGHEGRLVAGEVGGAGVVVLCGRSHYYEGLPLSAVTYPVRVLAAMGVRKLLLTNAAGGINPRYRAGDFMVIADHINFMGENPLRGWTGPDAGRFVDLTQAYDPGLRQWLKRAARAAKARVHEGVYLAVPGPSYETPAEIRAFARLGADAVGMSTVPEAIVARQCGMSVAGLSCITNLAAGRTGRPLSHCEVLETGERARAQAGELLGHFIALSGGDENREQL
jgi:purine-nucleoside phosphorylase